MSTNQIQAIIRKSSTVAATFTDKPSEAGRHRMKAAGAEFKSGQWVLTLPETFLGTEADAVKAFEALAALAKRNAA